MKRGIRVYVGWAGALALVGLAAQALAAENLLKNAGFEEAGKDGVPAVWQRECNPVLSGPFKLVADAPFDSAQGRQEGNKAVCLMTEEWNLDRPQALVQQVKLSQGTKGLGLSARCRGQGMLRLALRFMKQDQPLATVTNQPYFGTYILPVETEKIYGLGAEYHEYTLWAEVPAGADGVMVVIGNAKPMANLNPWSTLLIGSAALSGLEKAPEDRSTSNQYVLAKSVKAPEGCRDIAGYARIVTDPPCLNPHLLRDGIVKEPWESEGLFFSGTERYGVVILNYPAAIPMSNLCVHTCGFPQHVRVLGDPDGKGRYTDLLADIRGLGREAYDTWINIALPGKPVFGVRIEVLEGLGLTGWRTSAKWLNEVQLYAPADGVKKLENQLQAWSLKTPVTVFQPAKPGALGELVPSDFRAADDGKAKKFRKEMTTDLWMFGIPAVNFADPKKAAELDIGKFVNAPAFKALCNGCRRMGFDAVDIFLECGYEHNGESVAPWASKVCNSMTQNVIKAVVDGLHKEGLRTSVEIWSRYGPPFYSSSMYLCPQEETSRYPQMKQYPSVIHGDYARNNWGAMMDEILACGSDEVSLMWHEGYYKGHFMETFPKDDPGRELYRKRFGHELPGKEEDTLAFRQWIQMRHEGISDLFGHWTKELRKKYPKVSLIAGTMMQATAVYSYLTESGLPLDLLGARSGLDVIGTDYGGPYYMGLATAANGWRRVRMMNDANLWGPVSGGPKKPDEYSYAEVMRSMMYGMGVINYYRYNYTIDNQTAPGITRAMMMLRDLENLGVYEARPPDDVAILFSRAGVDWWQVRSWWGEKSGDPAFDRGAEGVRGWYDEHVVFDILQENGIPMQCRYLDQAGQGDDLARHKVLVIPFAWSVSKEAAAKIKQAAEKGTRVVLFDGKMGQTDEWGEPYEQPVLKELVDSGKAVLFTENMFEVGATEGFAQKVIAEVNKGTGGNLPLRLNRRGNRIDATVLVKNERECFLCLFNWDDAGQVDLGLRVPDGEYDVFVRDENQWLRLTLDGREKATAQQLASFKLEIEGFKPYVFFVRAVK